MVTAFTHELIFSHWNVLAIAYCWFGDFNLGRLKFRVVHGLPLKRYFLVWVIQWSVGYSFDMFGAELSIVSRGAFEFGFVSVIIVSCSGRSFNFDLERSIAFLVFGFIVEMKFVLNIKAFLRIHMRLNFIRFKILVVGRFQDFGIIMSLKDFITARLLFLRSDVISFEIVMIGGLTIEFGRCGRTMMVAWNEKKKYRKYRFGRCIYCCIAGSVPGYWPIFEEFALN